MSVMERQQKMLFMWAQEGKMRTYLDQFMNVQQNQNNQDFLENSVKKMEHDTGLASVICNCCNKELRVENGILKDECIHISHAFGYFSEKDGEIQCFDLCEECYNKMIAKFRLPVESGERTELL